MPEDDPKMNQDRLYMALRFIEDCMLFYRRMKDLPTCNDCARKNDCEYVPGWGELVRYNCPHWEKERDENGK